jgi:hypothetical protein
MMLALLAVLLGAPASAAGVSTAAASGAPGVQQSTQTVGSIYTGDRVRDPFMPATSGGGGSRAAKRDDGEPEPPPTADIHALTLRGILKDKNADFAIFAAETGETFMLRAGRLYNERNKPVQGITVRINLKQKLVELFTPERDRQPFIICESRDKEKDESKR